MSLISGGGETDVLYRYLCSCKKTPKVEVGYIGEMYVLRNPQNLSRPKCISQFLEQIQMNKEEKKLLPELVVRLSRVSYPIALFSLFTDC